MLNIIATELFNICYYVSSCRDPFMAAMVSIKEEHDARKIVAAVALASPDTQTAELEHPGTRLVTFLLTSIILKLSLNFYTCKYACDNCY